MLNNEIGENGDRLTFSRWMFIIDTIHAIAIDNNLQGFVEPPIARVLFWAAAMNQLMAACIEIIGGITWSNIIQAYDE